MEMSAVEQRLALDDTLPSVEDYLKRRMGTSAVTVCLALTEYEIHETRILTILIIFRYCLGMELPLPVMRSPEMKRLWDETNIIIFT